MKSLKSSLSAAMTRFHVVFNSGSWVLAHARFNDLPGCQASNFPEHIASPLCIRGSQMGVCFLVFNQINVILCHSFLRVTIFGCLLCSDACSLIQV